MVGSQNFPGFEYNVGIAYVIWPRDIDRESYVRKSLSTFTVSIATEDGGVRNRVPFAKHCSEDIVFPIANNEYGSIVVWILDPKSKRPIIIGVFKPNQEVGDLVEDFFKWKKEHGQSIVEISGSPRDRILNAIVNADEGGVLNVVVRNQRQENALLNMESTGNVEVLSVQDTKLVQYGYFKAVSVEKSDRDQFSSFQQTSSDQTFITDKFVVNKREGDGEAEAMVLGETFKELFDDFIDEVSRTTVSTAIGQMPILNAMQVAAFKQRTQDILSKLSFSE